MAAGRRDFLTIGEVVERLQPAHPELTISKLRFLEEEGLVSPERTPGGYRKFHDADIRRIEVILKLQREHFLPLAVIKDKLADVDRGKIPAELAAGSGTIEEQTLPLEEQAGVPLTQAAGALGIPATFVRELAEFGLITIVQGDSGEEVPGDEVPILHACWDMRRFGVEPRHLRMYATMADRQAQLFAQILMPVYRHRTAETQQRLAEALTELTRLSSDLDRLLLKRAVTATFDGDL
jgi:DNA-binding transcriptional MerR regulator